MSRQGEIRLTSFGKKVLTALPLLALLSWIVSEASYIYAATFMISIILLSYLQLKRRVEEVSSIKIERTLSKEFVTVGSEVEVRLTLKNQPGYVIHVKDVIPPQLSIFKGMCEAWLGSETHENSFSYKVVAEGLGLASFNHVEVEAYDSFTIFKAKLLLECRSELRIRPRLQPLRLYGPWPGVSGRGEESRLMSLYSRGLEYSYIREYQSGDDSKSIAWRLVSKRPDYKLLVKERRVKGRIANFIILDARECMGLGPRGRRKIDVAINITLLISLAALVNGEEVILGVHPERRILSFRGWSRESISKLLKALSEVSLSSGPSLERFYDTAVSRVQSSDRIYIITDLETCEDAETLGRKFRRRGNTVAILLLDTMEFLRPEDGVGSLRAAYNYLADRYYRKNPKKRRISRGLIIDTLSPNIRPIDIVEKYRVMQTWT